MSGNMMGAGVVVETILRWGGGRDVCCDFRGFGDAEGTFAAALPFTIYMEGLCKPISVSPFNQFLLTGQNILVSGRYMKLSKHKSPWHLATPGASTHDVCRLISQD